MNEQIKYGLRQIDIDNFVSIISENAKVERIVLFGSRAKGNFKNGSDIDLALIGKELKLNDILDFMVKIDDLFLPYKFDLIIYDRIQEPALIKHIDTVGKLLFER